MHVIAAQGRLPATKRMQPEFKAYQHADRA